MTCIVAIQTEEGVTMGGDSAGVAGYLTIVRSDPKVFVNDSVLIGYTTSFRMGQLLRYRLSVPKHLDPDVSDHHWLATEFIDAVRQCFTDFGWQGKDDNRDQGGTFLVAYKGALYEVDDDYQVGIPADGYAAVGCGIEFALGSLHATETRGRDTKQIPMPAKGRVRMALEAAEKFSGGVVGPFTILEQKKP